MLYEFFNQSVIYNTIIISIQRSTNLLNIEFITKNYRNFSVIEINNQLHPPDLLTLYAGEDGWAPFLAVPAT